VLCNSVLEHIDDIDPVLTQVARLLRTRGQFVFTVPGPDFHACLRGPLIPGVPRAAYLEHLDARLAHLRYWGRERWESELARHGMEVMAAGSYLTQTEVRRWEAISRVTAGVLYGLAGKPSRPIEIQRSLGMRRQGPHAGRGGSRPGPGHGGRIEGLIAGLRLPADPRLKSRQRTSTRSNTYWLNWPAL
jgi:SAM-dependent methyltransferase